MWSNSLDVDEARREFLKKTKSAPLQIPGAYRVSESSKNSKKKYTSELVADRGVVDLDGQKFKVKTKDLWTWQEGSGSSKWKKFMVGGFIRKADFKDKTVDEIRKGYLDDITERSDDGSVEMTRMTKRGGEGKMSETWKGVLNSNRGVEIHNAKPWKVSEKESWIFEEVEPGFAQSFSDSKKKWYNEVVAGVKQQFGSEWRNKWERVANEMAKTVPYSASDISRFMSTLWQEQVKLETAKELLRRSTARPDMDKEGRRILSEVEREIEESREEDYKKWIRDMIQFNEIHRF